MNDMQKSQGLMKKTLDNLPNLISSIVANQLQSLSYNSSENYQNDSEINAHIFSHMQEHLQKNLDGNQDWNKAGDLDKFQNDNPD